MVGRLFKYTSLLVFLPLDRVSGFLFGFWAKIFLFFEAALTYIWVFSFSSWSLSPGLLIALLDWLIPIPILVLGEVLLSYLSLLSIVLSIDSFKSRLACNYLLTEPKVFINWWFPVVRVSDALCPPPSMLTSLSLDSAFLVNKLWDG